MIVNYNYSLGSKEMYSIFIFLFMDFWKFWNIKKNYLWGIYFCIVGIIVLWVIVFGKIYFCYMVLE